ncbi:hypothetical protein HMPREF9946_00933 [Acetobacteraceae bacterium AT-5844]|nr:hypothetical protein HMPREF9946_00933 [Acetobacteraceae bacterium AT-5844]
MGIGCRCKDNAANQHDDGHRRGPCRGTRPGRRSVRVIGVAAEMDGRPCLKPAVSSTHPSGPSSDRT